MKQDIPWRWTGTKRDPKCFAYLTDNKDRVILASCEGLDLTESDACLIAAAPELLVALKRCLRFMTEPYSEKNFNIGVSLAATAIAKAENLK